MGLLVAAGVFVRSRRRHLSAPLAHQAVSGEWLAQARGRDEQEW
ncbi:MAG: hypothetical protein ACRD1V_11240 [Vicinamibacterales bacterium]